MQFCIDHGVLRTLNWMTYIDSWDFSLHVKLLNYSPGISENAASSFTRVKTPAGPSNL